VQTGYEITSKEWLVSIWFGFFFSAAGLRNLIIVARYRFLFSSNLNDVCTLSFFWKTQTKE